MTFFFFNHCLFHPSQTNIFSKLLQGIFYEIDSKNQSCEKKKLHCKLHPLDIPDNSKFHGTLNAGSASIEGEGVKVNVWRGKFSDGKDQRGAINDISAVCVTEIWIMDLFDRTSIFLSCFRELLHVCNHGLFAHPHHLLLWGHTTGDQVCEFHCLNCPGMFVRLSFILLVPQVKCPVLILFYFLM